MVLVYSSLLFWYTATLPHSPSLVSDMPIIWKSFFDFDMRLSNSSKWNDNKLMFKWNKEKGLPISLKVEFRSLIVVKLLVFSKVVFRINSFNEVPSIRDCWFCYMTKFNLFSNDYLNSLLFKTEYGRNILGQSIQ